jgi:murein DD-endopeptidase MepM/ murein hydrolase activator NlpD
MMERLKKVGLLMARLLFRYVKRMALSLILSMIPLIVIVLLVMLTLDSMFNLTGGMLNFTGRDDFDPKIGLEIKAAYEKKADTWKEGLTEEEIAQVYQYDHQLSWGILAAIDKLAYNFDDLSQMEKYLNQTFELVKPEFRFRKACDGRILLDFAHTYIGTYQYHYQTVYEKQPDGTQKCREVLARVDTDFTYEKLKQALRHYGLEDNQNVDIVIFQAYGFDRDLKDPRVKYLLPPEMQQVIARSPIGSAPRNERGEIDLYALLPERTPKEFIESMQAKVQVYDNSWRINKGRTPLGTLPRRGSETRFGTIAVAKDNPYGLQLGMKVYIPRYGYAIVEEFSDNINDDILTDRFVDKVAKFLFLSYDLLTSWLDDITNRTQKEEVVYLFMGGKETDEEKLVKAQASLSSAYTVYYQSIPIYILNPDFQIEPPNFEVRGKTFWDGSTWPITSCFCYRELYGKREFHDGVDWGVPEYIPVLAINSGIVQIAKHSDSAGNYVALKLDTQVHENNRTQDIVVRYLHLSKYVVSPGQRVQQGEVIGYVGSTGRSTGAHLHMDVTIGGKRRDPLKWIDFMKADGLLDVYGEQPSFEGGEISNPDTEKMEYVGEFEITAYTAGKESTGKEPGDPGYGITASGKPVRPNHTIAADWTVIPAGSIVKIEGLEPYYVVEDAGSDIKGNRIDIYMPELEDALQFGRQKRRVWIMKH